MRKHFIHIIFFFFILNSTYTFGQNVQWSTEVLSFSSQYGDEDYSAQKIIGLPDAANSSKHQLHSWIPFLDENIDGEYIHVKFEKPMRIQQIAIAESSNPGSIYRIFLFDVQGGKHLIYENQYPKKVLASSRLFTHFFELTDFDVKSLKLELNTDAVKGSNRIDAIAISNSDDPIEINVQQKEKNDFSTTKSKRSSRNNAKQISHQINSEYDEEHPIISHDGQVLYFTRTNHPQNIGENDLDDIWASYRQSNGLWSKAVNMGAPINNKNNNTLVCVDPTGNTLYLSDKSNDKIFISSKNGRTWSSPQALNIEDHYNQNNKSAYHVNTLGNTLLMATERDEGFGNLDFFVSFNMGQNNWSKPKNLGSTINSKGIERSIYLAADNQTIYFSSDGFGGMGGLDMFMSRRLDDTWTNWSEPINLGKQINTKADDFNFSIPASGEYAYFSSNQLGESYDLFQMPLDVNLRPLPLLLMSGRIESETTGRNLNAMVSYQSLDTNGESNQSIFFKDGKYQLILPYGENMILFAHADHFYPSSKYLALGNIDLEELDSGGLEEATSTSFIIDSEEIEQLRFQVRELNNELKIIEEKRERFAMQRKGRNNSFDNNKIYRSDLSKVEKRYNRISRDQNRGAYSPIKKKNDTELEELKQKFNQHNKVKDPFSNNEKEEQLGSESSKDDELEAMKRKFNKHFHTDEKPSSSNRNPTSITEETTAFKENYFEIFRDVIYQDMMIELENEVKLDLLEREFDAVKRIVKRELANQEIQFFDIDLSKNVFQELKEEFIQKIELDQLKTRQIQELKRKDDPDFWELENDLRSVLQKEVEDDLQSIHAENLGKKIRLTFSFHLKNKQRKEIQDQIESKIEDQKQSNKVIDHAPKHSPFTEKSVNKTNRSKLQKITYKIMEEDFILSPIESGAIIPLHNIFFDANKANLKKESYLELEQLIDFLDKHSNVIIEIGSHTNAKCSAEFALSLTENRAETIIDYLVKSGISSKNLQYKGYGNSTSIFSNETIEGRLKNQRIEIKFLN